MAPSSLVGEGISVARSQLWWVRGSHRLMRSRPPHPPALRAATLSHKGRGKEESKLYTGVKNGSGAPSVGFHTTLTFWPIFTVAGSQSTMLVCTEGPSFSVT